MSWFSKLLPSRIRTETGEKKGVPEGLWTKCKSCSAVLYRAELTRTLEVCPKCDHHHRIGVRERVRILLDAGDLVEIAPELEPIDRLKFRDSKKYKDRISAAHKSTGENEAIVAVKGKLGGIPVILTCFNFEFMGGSMGAAVGEKFVRATEMAIQEKMPLICVSASGGARKQEGLS
jgi:acetyl-CoA carboxylase carboxyl transferase subunit beta